MLGSAGDLHGKAALIAGHGSTTTGGAAPRVVVVAQNASTVAGGEAMLPWQYFRLLRARGVDAHLVTHERNRDDLTGEAPELAAHMHFMRDRLVSRVVHRAGMRLPVSVKGMTVWLLMGVITSLDMRRTVRRLVRSAPGATVVHEPVPVSPRQPSFMVDVGAPVVVGPLNGAMEYPPGFHHDVGTAERLVRRLLRQATQLANRLVDGKLRADLVLVANDRTRRALPRGVDSRRVREMVENGVDLSVFGPRQRPQQVEPCFAFVGRLVDWKRVDLLLQALHGAPAGYRLEVLGDGPLRGEFEQRAAALGLQDRVAFRGLLSHAECAEVLQGCGALVLPSVYECGGAVVLEAMAVGLPVIAVDWGGPADYVQHGVTGWLLAPESPSQLASAITAAMVEVVEDGQRSLDMGLAGRARVEEHFDWERKVDHVLGLYRELVRDGAAA